MKKIILILFLILFIVHSSLFIVPCQAADLYTSGGAGLDVATVTALTADTSPTSDDLVITVNAPGGTPSLAVVTLGNLWKGIFNLSEYDNGTCTTTKVVSAANGTVQKVTLGAACGVSWTQPASGTAKILLKVIQATGTHYNITWTSTKWQSAGAPTITATDAAVDIISCYLDGANVYCVPSFDFR